MFRRISSIGLIVLVILTAGIALGTLSAPCPTEDSTWCTWYADIQGNGQGYSYTSLTESFAIKH